MSAKVRIDISEDGTKVSAASQSALNLRYGWFNGGRISQVGSVSLAYDFNGRISRIAKLKIVYGWLGRVVRVEGTDDSVEVFIHTTTSFPESRETRKDDKR